MNTNKKLRALTLLLLSACTVASAQRTVTDMVGRKIAVPQKIRKAYCMSPVCTVFLYTLAPDLLAGWNHPPAPLEMRFLAEPYAHLPVLGGWFGKSNTGNIEEIIKAHPDILISMGNMGSDAMVLSVAKRVQEQTHLPVFIADGKLKSLDETYTVLGELLGRQARAAELGAYCRQTVTEIEQKVKTIPAARRKKVYYAEGPKGLETDPRGSMHSEALDFVGALNAADVVSEGGYGQTPVSMEDVLRWDPDIVIAGYDHNSSPGQFYLSVWKDAVWQQVRAVKNRQVYETPQFPYNWIDRPPSVNRIIGIKWLANLLYPDLFHYDIRAETRFFYQKFYHRQLTDGELHELLAQSIRRP